MKITQLTKLSILALAGVALSTTAYAENYLLTVDVTDIANVTFTTTGNPASVNDSSTTYSHGVELMDFFTSNSGFAQPATGNLKGGGLSLSYISASNGGGEYLNFHGSTFGDPSQNFTTSVAAFNGSASVDMSSASETLPGVGATGNIYAGNSSALGPIIGQWQVIGAAPVPEPGTLALAALGGAGALVYARRRK
jgi:hypothetical protein